MGRNLGKSEFKKFKWKHKSFPEEAIYSLEPQKENHFSSLFGNNSTFLCGLLAAVLLLFDIGPKDRVVRGEKCAYSVK